MKRITGISLVVWAVWGVVCGCKETDGQDEEKEQAMEGAVQKLKLYNAHTPLKRRSGW